VNETSSAAPIEWRILQNSAYRQQVVWHARTFKYPMFHICNFICCVCAALNMKCAPTVPSVYGASRGHNSNNRWCCRKARQQYAFGSCLCVLSLQQCHCLWSTLLDIRFEILISLSLSVFILSPGVRREHFFRYPAANTANSASALRFLPWTYGCYT